MLQRFFAALVYFTRIPSPIALSAQSSQGASSLAPLIGWIVGGVTVIAAVVAGYGFPPSIVVVIALIVPVWLTGALHEDGWSDFCDGFGGGWSREQILEIMRDSRAGVYGVVGLIVLLLLKFVTLLEIYTLGDADDAPSGFFLMSLLCAHALSRFTAISFMFSHDYASSNTPSRARSMTSRLTPTELFVAAFFGLLPLVILMGVESALLGLVVIPVVAVRFYFARSFERKLGGYTGDCLGAVQQVSETVIYLSLLLVLSV